MNCPDCGGPMWDNRNDKPSPKSPDFKCKDKDCGKAVWLKGKKAGGGDGGGAGAAPGGEAVSRPVPSTDPLAPIYAECMAVAQKCLDQYAGKGKWTAADLHGATSTLFISATKTGRSVRGAKKAAPAAKPTPRPQTVPDDDEFPGALRDDSDSLPF